MDAILGCSASELGSPALSMFYDLQCRLSTNSFMPNSVSYLLFTDYSGKAQFEPSSLPTRVYTLNQYAMLFLEVSFSFRCS